MVAPPFPLWLWLVFVGLVLALLFLDLFVLHRNAREVPFGEALWLSGFDDYHGDQFLVRQAGKRCATPLLAALVVVEASDLLFAVDSVPAVLSVTQTAFVAYSSIVFAVLGLRALYFALEGLIDRFVYLHYGLAVILVFVGAKFVAQGFGVQMPIITSLLVIAVAITASIAVSLGATRGAKRGEA